MPKPASSGDTSLSLPEVLEAEFTALHGELPADYPGERDSESRLRSLWAAVHQLKVKRAALCLSGGGIRSATFGLGVLQGLARCGLLDQFHYLSTVSGGGYIGSWLSAWIKNHPLGLPGVVEELKRRPDSTLDPEPRPIRHLREFSNYLSPRAGLTSVDFWTLMTTFARNMFLNWLVLISWLAAAMMAPRLYLSAILLPPSGWQAAPNYLQMVRAYDIGLSILLGVALVLIAVAMAYSLIDVPSTGNARLSQRAFLKYRQLPLLLASLVLAVWWAIFRNVHGSEPFDPATWLLRFVAFSVASYLAGGALGAVILALRKERPRRRAVRSILRLGAILLAAGFAGFCLWVAAIRLFFAPAENALNYVCFAPALILGTLLLVNFLFTGLASWVTEDEDREWWGRSAAWLLITIAGWMTITVIVLWGAQAVTATRTGNHLEVFLGQIRAGTAAKAVLGAFGGVTGIAGALLAIRSKLSGKVASRGGFQWVLLCVALVFFVLLSIVLSWLLLLAGLLPWVQNPNDWLGQLIAVCVVTGAMLFFGLVMGFFINANKFSLHASYRNRLIRAFLAASRTVRRPHLFTGFDPDDNMPLHELPREKPLHVLNGTLNLVKGEQLAWQERRAESFTMSRLHCGSFRVGYRPSEKYGNGITLGTAMAISGAAANPNMGYHSSPLLGMLMTLFNVRLGWWLGNPGPAGNKTWQHAGPRYSVGPLFSEAAGHTTDRYKYVNLSDGGHFENLGLYEMVLRRCHYIVVSDGGGDPDYAFADLGEAVRKIRIDFGIPIEFGTITIYSRSAIETLKVPGHHCAIGRIRYSVVDGDGAPDGVIVYIKPACYGDEPRDICEYSARNPTFPNESTSDQFFSESQFESYRMLGAYTMEKLCNPQSVRGDFGRFVGEILRCHLQTETPDWLTPLLDSREG